MFPLVKTISSIKRAKLFSLMIGCALLAVLVVIALIVLITWGTSYLVEFEKEWVNTIFTSLAGVLSSVGGWFMLPSLTILIGGMFQETVIHRVEKHYYPDKMRKESPKFWPDFFHDVRFTIKSIFLNILIFPTYFFAIGFVISILLNTYLLGREFFETAAGPHHGKAKANKMLKKNKSTVYGSGLVIILMNLIPILNIFVPIIGMVWMVHVYHFISNKAIIENTAIKEIDHNS
ncbi:MAG: EI24 domain-containing protein [Calditrichaceae bacterium]